MKKYEEPISLEKLTKLYEVEMEEPITIYSVEEYNKNYDPLTINFVNLLLQLELDENEKLIYLKEKTIELITKTKFVCQLNFKDENSDKVRIFVSENKEIWYHILNGKY